MFRSRRGVRRLLMCMSLAGGAVLFQVPACAPQEPDVIAYQVLTILRSLAVDVLGYGLIRPFN